jgi:hypothetical protein
VVCDGLPWIHFEVKAVERLNIEAAMEQARRDCGMRSAECCCESWQCDTYRLEPEDVLIHALAWRHWRSR